MRHVLFVTLILNLPSMAFSYTPGKTYKVTVLHTNDHHGAFWKNNKGEYGSAARATLIERLRTEVKDAGGYVLLLDGGDVNTGTPESEIADAEPDFRAMSMMKYDAMAVGNHEFDKPYSVLQKQKTEWANFPMLSANIYSRKTQKRVFEASKTIKIDDLTVSILGLTTDQTPDQSIRFPKNELEVRSPIVEAAKIVPTLRKRSDLVIAVTHMGHYWNEQHGSRAPGDVTLARKVDGIDLIVGGHTQIPLFNADYENGAYIVQAGEWGKHLGRVDLEYRDGKVTKFKYELIPVNLRDESGALQGREILENEALLTMLKPFKDSADKLTTTVVGRLSGKFEGHRSVIRKQETNLGNFVTHLMLKETQADVAVINSGVIRNSMEPGDVTMGQILSVLPPAFGLRYSVVEFTGKELWNYMGKVALLTDGAYPQLGAMKVIVKNGKLAEIQVKSGGAYTTLDMRRKYKMASVDFISNGGDGYPTISTHPTYRQTNIVDSDAMRRYFEENKTVNADDFAPVGNFQSL